MNVILNRDEFGKQVDNYINGEPVNEGLIQFLKSFIKSDWKKVNSKNTQLRNKLEEIDKSLDGFTIIKRSNFDACNKFRQAICDFANNLIDSKFEELEDHKSLKNVVMGVGDEKDKMKDKFNQSPELTSILGHNSIKSQALRDKIQDSAEEVEEIIKSNPKIAPWANLLKKRVKNLVNDIIISKADNDEEDILQRIVDKDGEDLQESDKEALQKEIDDHKKEIDDLKEQIKNGEGERSDLEDEIKQHKKDIKTLQDIIDENNDGIDDLKDMIERQKSEIEDMKKKLQDNESKEESESKTKNADAEKEQEDIIKEIEKERLKTLSDAGVTPLKDISGDKALTQMMSEFEQIIQSFKDTKIKINESKSIKDIINGKIKGDEHFGLSKIMETIYNIEGTNKLKNDCAKIFLKELKVIFDKINGFKNDLTDVPADAVQSMFIGIIYSVAFAITSDNSLLSDNIKTLLARCSIESDATIGYSFPLVDESKPDEGTIFVALMKILSDAKDDAKVFEKSPKILEAFKKNMKTLFDDIIKTAEKMKKEREKEEEKEAQESEQNK